MVSWNILNSKKVQFVKRNWSCIYSLLFFQVGVICLWTMFLKSIFYVSIWKTQPGFQQDWFKRNELICLFLGTNSILKRKAPVIVGSRISFSEFLFAKPGKRPRAYFRNYDGIQLSRANRGRFRPKKSAFIWNRRWGSDLEQSPDR